MAEQQNLEKGINVILQGYAYYAFVHAPQKDAEYGDKYKIDLMLEDENGNPVIYDNKKTGVKVDMMQWAKDNGVRINEPTQNIPGHYIRLSSKALKADGTARPAIPVKCNGALVGKETLIGNGSLVKVEALLKAVPKQKNKVAVYLNSVVVMNLIPYVSALADDDFDFARSAYAEAAAKDKAQTQASLEAQAPANDHSDDDEFDTSNFKD